MLEILWKHRHPVGIITKSQLILRDLDILRKLAENRLVNVSISVTTLDESLRLKLEPRTTTGANRLKTVKRLSEAGISVNIMMAPIIPSINDKEIFDIAEKTSIAGAKSFNYTIVRMNGDVGDIFRDWLSKTFPDKYDRVIHQIESCHGGKVNDSRFGTRMSGEGNIASMIKQQVGLAREKFFTERIIEPLDKELFYLWRDRQLRLF